jgi:hypothetical protein
MAAESATGQPAVNCMNFDELESRPFLSMDCQRAARRQPLAANDRGGRPGKGGRTWGAGSAEVHSPRRWPMLSRIHAYA